MGDQKSTHIKPEESRISREEREARTRQQAVTIWLTGLSGSGKSTIANLLERALFDQGRRVFWLDGDNVRFGLNRDLGFSPEDRKENIRRIAEVAALFNTAGIITIASFISPYREDREQARGIIGSDRFYEVFLDTPLDVCEKRDAKGLYQKARAGEIKNFTGIHAPYEEPTAPALRINTAKHQADACVRRVLETLKPGELQAL